MYSFPTRSILTDTRKWYWPTILNVMVRVRVRVKVSKVRFRVNRVKFRVRLVGVGLVGYSQ